MEKDTKAIRKRAAKQSLRRHRPYQEIALKVLVAAGALTVAALAPNVLGVIADMDPAFKKDLKSFRRLQETLWRMERKGLLKRVREGKGLWAYALTTKGEKVVDDVLAERYVVSTSRWWDGKWRVVMFDVPERKRSARAQLRILLERAGFVRLHDSVWVQPYPCADFVTLIRAHLKSASGELHYFIGDLFESDKFLRERFDLS